MKTTDVVTLPPQLKRKDLEPCAACGKGVLHTGVPLAWRVTIERFGLDRRAIDQQHGLELLIGDPRIAHVMGPDGDLAKRIDSPDVQLLCEQCFAKPYTLLVAFDRAARRDRDLEPREASDGPAEA